MRFMLSACTQLQNLDFSGWTTSSVQYMHGMFSGCTELSTLTVSSAFEFKQNNYLDNLPNNTGTTTYHWVKDDYEEVYDSTNTFTTAHNQLAETDTNHVYKIQKKYQVSFDLAGGSGSTPPPQFVFENKMAQQPDYLGTKGALVFNGWTLNQQSFSFETPITEPIEVVASWRMAKYIIVYDANGGSGNMPHQELSVDKETALSANQFSRTHYTFNKWTRKPDGSGTSYTNKQAVKIYPQRKVRR